MFFHTGIISSVLPAVKEMRLPPHSIQFGLLAIAVVAAVVIGLVVAVLRGCGVIRETME